MLKFVAEYRDIPLVKLFILYLIGLVLGLYFYSLNLSLILCSIFLVLAFFKYYQFKNQSVFLAIKLKKVNQTLIYSCFLVLGFLLSNSHTQINSKSHYARYIEKKEKQYVELKILKAPIEKENSYKLIAKIEKLKGTDNYILCTGKILLYFEKDKSVKQLKANDIIKARININEINKPKNSNEFDYKNYLKYQNIYYQSYIPLKDWGGLTTSTNELSNVLDKIRRHLQKIINLYIIGSTEQAVASALLLGNRSYLTDDIVRAFSSSGATHILAVSGLHVGILYGIVSILFSLLKKNKYSSYMHPVFTIGFIWFYVLLTGGSPSVIRAATMFSLIALGKAIRFHISIYNIIAFSALIITAFNPFIITEVGFQLSYIAVIGIIHLQDKIYKLLFIKNKIGDIMWKITSVSIAAQIATFPLIVLYFHQFPNLFWISNIVVIPAATVILHIGIVFFCVSYFDPICKTIGWLLSYIIKFLNICLSMIEQIPYALSTKLYISYTQTILMYLAIILFLFGIEKRNKKLIRSFLIVLMILSISFSIKHTHINRQKTLIVYHIPNHSAIEFIDKTTSYSYFDTSLLNNENLMIFRVKHNWWEKQIRTQHFDFKALNVYNYHQVKLIQFENQKIACIDSSYRNLKTKLEVDYMIISHTPKLKLENLHKNIKAKVYIFDTSNNKYKQKLWKKDCEDLKLNCYFVSDTTAFELEF